MLKKSGMNVYVKDACESLHVCVCLSVNVCKIDLTGPVVDSSRVFLVAAEYAQA